MENLRAIAALHGVEDRYWLRKVSTGTPVPFMFDEHSVHLDFTVYDFMLTEAVRL